MDMFNEGVDLPLVDTVSMLRPTESRILWLQQFGRGLRTANGKDRLTVIDYIGNHRVFLLKVRALFNLGQGHSEIARVLDRLRTHRVQLPPGCQVTYDLVAVDILRSLLPAQTMRATRVDYYYDDFKERHGLRPLAVEAFHDGYDPRTMRRCAGSWLTFVDSKGDLNPNQKKLLLDVGDFLNALEATAMTRSFKMLTLLAMLHRNALPGSVDIGELAFEFGRLAGRSAVLKADVGVSLDDDAQLRKYLERNPVGAWTEGKGTGGRAYFAYEGGVFSSAVEVAVELRADFQEPVREIVDWRLAEYPQRQTAAVSGQKQP